jgi:hypothetical protein
MAIGETKEKLMIELRSNKLLVSFPELPMHPELTIAFQRTLRIPDDGRDYPLPPGLGCFPLRHIDDYAERVSQRWLKRGGVLLPMWQSEAMWLNFDSAYLHERNTAYPFALKIATGKINAVTGESWARGLSRNPQNYLAVPEQPWLDGYCVENHSAVRGDAAGGRLLGGGTAHGQRGIRGNAVGDFSDESGGVRAAVSET